MAYKAHLAVDEGSGFVRQAEMTAANVHDFCLAEALIQGDVQGYFVDKAYAAKPSARRSDGAVRFVVAMNMKRALERNLFRPIRPRALHEASEQALRPQDARTLFANHPSLPAKSAKTQKTAIVRSARYNNKDDLLQT